MAPFVSLQTMAAFSSKEQQSLALAALASRGALHASAADPSAWQASSCEDTDDECMSGRQGHTSSLGSPESGAHDDELDQPSSKCQGHLGAGFNAAGLVEDEPFQQYCTNCTGPLSASGLCEDCGHDAAHDDALFDDGSMTLAASASALTSVQQCQHLEKHQQVALLWDERMMLHEEQGQASPHPERPDRVRAVVARLLASRLNERCQRVDCRPATLSELAAVHTKELIHHVQAMSNDVDGSSVPLLMTSDTYTNKHTYECARLAAGGAVAVACMVASGGAPHGAAIVRPPGHHAESGMAMGFCFFNNAAVAARAAQAAGCARVLILDWDIHFGNGTHYIFEDDPSVMYMSIHRHDGGRFYPGTGAASEVGSGPGEGFSVNVAWDGGGLGNGDYLSAFHQLLLPIAYEFDPQLIIVSAGFDAAEGDPIGECRVTPECFAHLTSMLKAVAPTVVLLEGGYNLASTAASTEACLRVLLGEAPPPLPGPRYPSPLGIRGIAETGMVHARYWRSVSGFASGPSTGPLRQAQVQAELLQHLGANVYNQAMVSMCLSSPGLGGGHARGVMGGRVHRQVDGIQHGVAVSADLCSGGAGHGGSQRREGAEVAQSTPVALVRRGLPRCRKLQVLLALQKRAMKLWWKARQRRRKERRG